MFFEFVLVGVRKDIAKSSTYRTVNKFGTKDVANLRTILEHIDRVLIKRIHRGLVLPLDGVIDYSAFEESRPSLFGGWFLLGAFVKKLNCLHDVFEQEALSKNDVRFSFPWLCL